MKQQFVYINGGVPKENFKDYYDMLKGKEYTPHKENFLSWNKTLGKNLGEDWEYLRVPLHDRDFADYTAWVIMFEKMIPYFNDEILLGAGSLGGSFILKYIGENDGITDYLNDRKIKIKKLFLLAPAISDTPDEVLGSFSFDLKNTYHRIARWTDQIYIYHSSDDTMVPFEQSLEVKNYFPEATFREFDDKGHFFLEERIEELEADIKN